MARALVVAKAKIDNNPQDRQIRDHRWPMQTRLAQQLHENGNVPLGPCGIEEAKQFQAYLTNYQFKVSSFKFQSFKFQYCVQRIWKQDYLQRSRQRQEYLFVHARQSPACLGSLLVRTIVILVRKPTIIATNTFVQIRASAVDFLSIVLRCPG